MTDDADPIPDATLHVHRAADHPWQPGLRPYFQYRDLGLAQATGGRMHAHVLRAVAAGDGPGGTHRHDVHFHWAYVLAGWAEFEFRDHGVFRVQAGDAYYMPEGIHHELLSFSADFEQIEMHAPATIGAFDVPDWRQPA